MDVPNAAQLVDWAPVERAACQHEDERATCQSSTLAEYGREVNRLLVTTIYDWSDAPYRIDRAGHQRWMDGNNPNIHQLDESQTNAVKLNVVWVTAQVLGYHDPNLNIYEFAEACGVPSRTLYTSRGQKSGILPNGLRRHDGGYVRPGYLSVEDERERTLA
jgi:hypothetical protein